MTWTPKQVRNSADKQRTLVSAARIGKGTIRQDALGQIVEAMTPYVVVAVNSVGVNSVEDKEDLIMEGHLAVIEAIELYDPTRENMFSTYAYYRIRMAISQWLARNSGTIPMPYEAWRIARLVDGHEVDAGRELTSTELQELTGKGYARRAADARQQYVQIDHFDDHKLYQETWDLDELIVEFVIDLSEMPEWKRERAAAEFCLGYDLDSSIAEKLVEAATEVKYDASSAGPRSDNGRRMADRKRRGTKSRNSRR